MSLLVDDDTRLGARYDLLASALAGKSLAVLRTPDGDATYTDGRVVFLGAGHESTLRVAITVQCALLSAGSLEPALARRLMGRPALARRYLVVEAVRALEELGSVRPRFESTVERDLVTPRADTSSAEESLAVALSRAKLPDPPEYFGTIRPRRLLASRNTEHEAPSEAERLSPFMPETLPELNEEEESQRAGLGKLFDNPRGSRGRLARLLQKLVGAARQPDSGAGGSELPTGSSRAVSRVGSKALLTLTPMELPPPTEAPALKFGVAVYPEWNRETRRYRNAWCTVAEVVPRLEDLLPLERTPRHDEMRRRLAPLGLGLQRRRRRPNGDDIDLDALVELRVAARTGDRVKEDIFIDQLRLRRDLGVLVLLDISGSSNEQSPYGGRLHDHQRDAAAALVDTLQILGDRVACYAFQSQGRSAVYFLRVKSFDDPLDSLVLERFGGLVPGAYTRMGAAVRHATHILATRSGTSRRLLVVLSDGFPYDQGYEGPYGEADARRAIGEAQKQGVGCLCLSISGGSDPEALKRVFGSTAHASAPRLDDLAPSLGVLFRGALRLADQRRRMSRAFPIPSRSA